MAKTKKINSLSKGQKYERQKLLNANRVRKFRENMTEEQLEEKRKKDRERYHKKKEQNLVKSINELSEREKRRKRKLWRVNAKKYRIRKKRDHSVLKNTPPPSDEENNEQVAVESVQRKRGRKKVKRDRSKAYRTIHKQEQKIKGLERLIKKYQKRLERLENNKSTSLESPSPNKKVNILLGKERVSPEVKKRLFVGYALEKQLKTIKTKTSSKSKVHQVTQKVIGSKILRKYRVQKYFSNIISYKYNHLQDSAFQYKRKKHMFKTKRDLYTKLMDFYEDDTVSRMCAGKKEFVRKGKLKIQRRILLDTLKKLHKRFEEESGCRVPYSSFVRARPFWVTHPTAKDRDTCTCIVHSNVDLMVSGLYNIKALKVRSGKDALESIVCSLKKKSCLTGNCKMCMSKALPFNEGMEEDINVKIYTWIMIKEKRVIKGKVKHLKRMVKEREVMKLRDAKEKLKMMMVRFKQHVSNLLHQASHKKQVQKNLSCRQLVLMLDFSENYVAKFQSEVQSMHFGASKKQLSLHTVVCYFNDGEKIVPKSFCTVSDNLAHQAFAVWAHLDPILENLSKEFPQTSVVHFFSDSPSSQYRNRTNLYLLKTLMVNYFPLLRGLTWNYSEPGHGKGAMDGIGGSLKRRADELVLHGKDITKASDFVKYFQDSKITLFEIKNDEIESVKKSVPSNIAPVPQITKMKQITYCLQEKKMFGRTLSCHKCPYNKKCQHYNLREIFSPSNVARKKISNPGKLNVTDVWSSDDDDEQVASNEVVPGTSKNNFESDSSDLVTDLSNIRIGNHLLVRFVNTKANNIRQFIGVCQELDSEEVKVMFLKPVNDENNLFSINENDVSYVSMRQVVAVLPPPTLVVRGNRLFYKFNHAIHVF